jgi:hypothetical protein
MLLGTFASQMGARIAVEQAYLGSLNARQLAKRDWLYASRYAVALFSRQFAISQFPFTAENFPTYLQGHRFDAETVRLLGIAFEMAIVALQQGDGIVSPTREAVAQKIIELAKAGERDPERLCDGALKATQPMAPVIISDPSPLPPPA